MLSALSCTSSVISGAIGASGLEVSPLAHQLWARRLQLPQLQGSRPPRLVLLSPQSTPSQYLGTSTTTRGRRHQRSLRTFHYGGLWGRSLRDLRNGLSLGKGCGLLNCW
jgi:hypothetical protein